eukprot:TRINITY_DN6050_c0_g3_i1.p1 TRINITY_DN6050_c0_g3~~TRINITY_DN6050_c0_g3_i1.p1  ORF type:complete len:692 (-),score=119.28 TRINITY_DN6050_c0_g3_i1:343-2292(-)
MSARQLQRLRQQLKLEQSQEFQQEEQEDEEEINQVAQKSEPFNPFDLLNDEDDEEEQQEDQETQHKFSQEVDASEVTMKSQDSGNQTQQSSKKKNKKRNKSKKKSKQGIANEDTQRQQSGDEGDEDIDQVLAELNIKPVASSSNAGQHQETSSNVDFNFPSGSILQIDHKCLKPELELRKIFGNQVVDEEEARAEAEQRRLLPRNVRLPQLRKGILITPKLTWPRPEGGLSMDKFKNRYQYTYSASYTAVQELFEQYQSGFDPNNIVDLLRQSPYHLDSLLAMHDLYRATGEHAAAEEMIERCIFALEAAWHPTFRPNNACTLSFEYKENQPFFKAMFKHLVSLGRRGCHRTALEYCKFVLSLDDQDPMGLVFCIDYYAIRANEYGWLVRFVNEYGNDINLMILPNILFSYALAKQNIAQEFPEAQLPGLNSDDQLLQAIFTFPMAVVALLDKLKELGVSGWGDVLSRPLFAKHKGYGGSASLEHLVALFVRRSHLLWKVPQVLLWLKKCCIDACNRYDAGGSVLMACSFDDWAVVREANYPPSQENEYRHLRLEEFGDDLSTIPREELNAAMAGQGADEAALQQEIERLQQLARQGRVQISEEELQGSNPLMVLVRSILPWVDVGEPPSNNDDQGNNQDPRPPQEGEG